MWRLRSDLPKSLFDEMAASAAFNSGTKYQGSDWQRFGFALKLIGTSSVSALSAICLIGASQNEWCSFSSPVAKLPTTEAKDKVALLVPTHQHVGMFVVMGSYIVGSSFHPTSISSSSNSGIWIWKEMRMNSSSSFGSSSGDDATFITVVVTATASVRVVFIGIVILCGMIGAQSTSIMSPALCASLLATFGIWYSTRRPHS
ncbi:uncharacterized protein G2W53_017649 [Senna tora]|uniref:Uncharacterized protein n=1 Tax=Senna tora TaxID=362788 RepID=A0A834TQP8_9FABA|nr:uncharacterized protein G2W53_017649 [Senna tora]